MEVRARMAPFIFRDFDGFITSCPELTLAPTTDYKNNRVFDKVHLKSLVANVAGNASVEAMSKGSQNLTELIDAIMNKKNDIIATKFLELSEQSNMEPGAWCHLALECDLIDLTKEKFTWAPCSLGSENILELLTSKKVGSAYATCMLTWLTWYGLHVCLQLIADLKAGSKGAQSAVVSALAVNFVGKDLHGFHNLENNDSQLAWFRGAHVTNYIGAKVPAKRKLAELKELGELLDKETQAYVVRDCLGLPSLQFARYKAVMVSLLKCPLRRSTSSRPPRRTRSTSARRACRARWKSRPLAR